MTDISMFIDGERRAATGGATFERRNPLDGNVATRAPAGTPADAVAAVDAAQAPSPGSQTGPSDAARCCSRPRMRSKRAPTFVQAMARETGASALWAGFNVHLAAGILTEAASLTTQISGEVIPSDVPGSLAMGVRQAAGVVLGIAPWNAPVILATRAVATPLACGNTVVLKGSELCPATHG
jgi:benzaldehyde dehydrogenase (NAD)